MSEAMKTEATTTNRRGGRRYGNKPGRMFANFPIAGRVLADYARFTAPSPDEARIMLLTMRRDFGMARGHAAGFLAVAEATVKAWEKGTRCPSVLARRCIQLLDGSLRGR